jgi:hypothetical protein
MTSARREAEKAFKKTEVDMESDISLDDLMALMEEKKEQIIALGKEFKDLQKAYRDKKLAGVKSAMEARKSADDVLREELKAIGALKPLETQTTGYSSYWLDPTRLYTKWY